MKPDKEKVCALQHVATIQDEIDGDPSPEQKVYALQHVATSTAEMDAEANKPEKVCALQHVATSPAEVGAEANKPEKVYALQHVAISEELERIANGYIPDDLDRLAAIGTSLLAVNAKTRQTISVIVAAARVQLSLKEWVTWCDDRFQLDTCARSQMAAVGRLLLACLESNRRLYLKAFPLDFAKTYALTAIQDDQVVAFMVPNIDAIRRMSREEVRVLVARHLGKENKPKHSPSPALPGFESLIDTFAAADELQLATAVQSAATADKAITASQRILNSAIVYYHASSDIIRLHEIKNLIKGDLLADLEAAIAMLAQEE